jgi:hypothetical protein
MATQNSNNTGKQSGAPALPNNFQGAKPADDSAPKCEGGTTLNFTGPSDSENRGKDGTSK